MTCIVTSITDTQQTLRSHELDIFTGSGQTNLASEKLGRQHIGIDIAREYLDYARKRLEDHIEQGRLVNGDVSGQGDASRAA